ncbi:hypothetical protein SAMN05661010_03570 [Modicisalibacter muralis]|uniref:Uncharacterized protein n=1 Tax=Modicisalibacter muralis TaxID=119000 RepID=A0A1G9R2K1_9GAMM|nr:hypothetical protein [Halomonas muralis]SDM17516.1 hypothetical protein SAMN05661010_03570 [Halomonas muralis]
MAEYDSNFKDESGFMSLFLGVVVLIGMSVLPATITWIQYFN